MIIVVIVILLFVIFYLMLYKQYSESIIDFMMNVRFYKKTYREVEEQLEELAEDEVIEIHNRYYRYTVDKENIKEYYLYMINRFEELKRKYSNISSDNLLYCMEEELEDMLRDEYISLEKLVSEIKVKKWRINE